jgi:hypothetical protein
MSRRVDWKPVVHRGQVTLVVRRKGGDVQTLIRFVSLAVVLLTLSGSAIVAARLLKQVSFCSIDDGFVLVETSPDGRLGSPYHTTFLVPLWMAGVALVLTFAVVACAGVGLWTVFFASARHSSNK